MNTEIMTKSQAICLVYLKLFTPENLSMAKLAMEEYRLEVCYKDDPQLPFLLPRTTYNRAIMYKQVQDFPDEAPL
ncbi:hypothetical protein MAM1_0699c11132 [Mucor ambiguus]|uniref:Uncharacterized protein n=1 Tax=Mucor ambiguus TaxID=91626 RepID=A0A0C9N9W9_9FUNG|nr:hypothetical protein MAM1_0699c11132 [Mucor ambiguus]